ncbi:MAG: RsmB/NOP family class I SAM-dependent RNA methyltransferase [Fervidicoccaceae archaeon]
MRLICSEDHWVASLEIPDLVVELLRPVLKPYGLSLEDALCAAVAPPKRYYVRVTTLKSTASTVISKLRRESLAFREDGRFEEAIYAAVEKGLDPSSLRAEGRVVADRFAAESVALGADLYAPGVVSVRGEVGRRVHVVDPDGRVVGWGTLVDNPLARGERRGLAVKVEASPYRAPKMRETEAYREGLIYDQALPSMLVGRMLSPREHDVVLDATASPGGKATHVYELSRGRALVIAVDHTIEKVGRLIENVKRLGHRGIAVMKADSRRISSLLAGLRPTRVLVDPPCSGLGVRPRLRFELTREKLDALVRLQRRLLAEASRAAAPGALISYSTCTLTREENEDLIAWARRELGLKPEEPPTPFPQSLLTDHAAARFVPGEHDSPGFFACVLRKP